jgi:hypothetical protein
MQKRILSIPTLLSIIAIAVLTVACPAAFAAERAETTTYVDGNLNGVSPNTGGTLMFSDDKAMYFRTGLSTVAVPYSSISHSELGATKETSHSVPLYKVWALHKRGDKTETQLLIVNFRNDAGEDKTMTLELAKASAPGVLSLIQSRSAADPAPAKALVASTAPATPSPEAANSSASELPAPPAQPTAESKKESKYDAKAEAKAENKKDKDGAFASKPNNPAGAWWGDDFWKTKRNTDKWNAKMPATPGNDQR